MELISEKIEKLKSFYSDIEVSLNIIEVDRSRTKTARITVGKQAMKRKTLEICADNPENEYFILHELLHGYIEIVNPVYFKLNPNEDLKGNTQLWDGIYNQMPTEILEKIHHQYIFKEMDEFQDEFKKYREYFNTPEVQITTEAMRTIGKSSSKPFKYLYSIYFMQLEDAIQRKHFEGTTYELNYGVSLVDDAVAKTMDLLDDLDVMSKKSVICSIKGILGQINQLATSNKVYNLFKNSITLL